MTNLKLITTETFRDLPCNFYRNMNDDVLLTREQIGRALEYANPDVALSIIHKKHKDRLDNLSVVTKLISTDGKEYNTMLYTERGIMEICRWSRQPKANLFMDWVWDVIESYRHNELPVQDVNKIAQELTQAITTLTQSMIQLQQDMANLKESTQRKTLPESKYSRWKKNTFDKLRLLTDYVNTHSDQELELRDTMHIILEQVQNTYDFELSDYVQEYMFENSLDTRPYDLDVIEYYKDVRKMYTLTLDSILKKLNLATNETKKNIFDELIEKLKETNNE